MYGGVGDDTYEIYNSNAGAIIELAGEGTDTVVISSVIGDISYALPANVENGDAEGDDPEASDTLTGNELNNSLFVSSWNVATVHGGAGNDVLSFSADIGQLYGDSGDDTLMGGFGDDLLVGGAGADTMTGSAGKDRFIYTDVSDSTPGAHDLITDFAPSATGTGDRIDLSAIDADTSVVGNQAFSWNTTTPTAHGLWFNVVNNGNGTFEITFFADVNGDTTPELEFHVHQTGSVNPGADIIL
jgi:serralysin